MIQIDKEEFEKISKNYEKYDSLRENVIILSRSVLKESKRLLFAMHRGKEGTLDALEDAKSRLDLILQSDASLSKEGSYIVAMQEYVEAKAYYCIINEKKLLRAKDFGISDEIYILGICDLCGELTRHAVISSINKKYDVVEELREFVSNIFECLLLFNPRNGNLRKKIDAVKWELKKMEDLMLELSLK